MYTPLSRVEIQLKNDLTSEYLSATLIYKKKKHIKPETLKCRP